MADNTDSYKKIEYHSLPIYLVLSQTAEYPLVLVGERVHFQPQPGNFQPLRLAEAFVGWCVSLSVNCDGRGDELLEIPIYAERAGNQSLTKRGDTYGWGSEA